MPKEIVGRARRRRASLVPARIPGREKTPPARGVSTPAIARDSRPLLERIMDTPHLEQVVPRLPAALLHRVIQTCGLEDCGELVALTTPGQLAQVLDHDLWRAAAPGRDEQLDADRFGVW